MQIPRTFTILPGAVENAITDKTVAILPVHVTGPLMCINHDQAGSWQNCIKLPDALPVTSASVIFCAGVTCKC